MRVILAAILLTSSAFASIEVSALQSKVNQETSVLRIQFGLKAFNLFLRERNGTQELTDIEFLNEGDGPSVITKSEREAIAIFRDEALKHSRNLFHNKLFDLITEMMPVGEEIPQHLSVPTQLDEVGTLLWKNLCKYKGKLVEGRFTAKNRVVKESAIIGEKLSECAGQCGAGCKWIGQYTQQCLNHDLCTRKTGGWFGQCTDEFIIAIPGFLMSPPCFN